MRLENDQMQRTNLSFGCIKSVNDLPYHISLGKPKQSVMLGVVNKTMPSLIDTTQ